MNITQSLLLGFMLVSTVASLDYVNTCKDREYCARNRLVHQKIVAQNPSAFSYYVDTNSLAWNDNSLMADLKLSCGSSLYLASEVKLQLSLYQDGILRVVLDEKDVNSKRFRLANQSLGAVIEEQQLINVTSLENLSTKFSDRLEVRTQSQDGQDSYLYTIRYNPFRIEQSVNNILTVIVNDKDSLVFENYQRFITEPQNITNDLIKKDCFYKIIKQMTANQTNAFFGQGFLSSTDWLTNYTADLLAEETSKYPRESFMLGFTMASEYLYGLPERAETIRLKVTDKLDPYRLYAIDIFPHEDWNMTGLYSGIPYITGHNTDHDESILWISAAENWVDIQESTIGSNNGRFVNFLTEGGLIEFFMIGSAAMASPKRVQKQVATITGFQALPQFFALGFHYSKWENLTSAQRLMYYNTNFEAANIPVDVFYMDIKYTDNRKWFTFSNDTFPEADLEQLKQEIANSSRHLVAISDPHIKQDSDYFVYANGTDLDMKLDKDGNMQSIFVKNSNLSVFVGTCWPGNSTWIDFLNNAGSEYYSSLYQYDSFKGTNELFFFWNDMNEPSVFTEGEEGTLRRDSKHVLANGDSVFHRDAHNIYGLMNHRATHNGLMTRGNNQVRPFILSRSAYFGTQKFSAKWTGDNLATTNDINVSFNQIMTFGLAGIMFTGADIPGFSGFPSDDLFVMFYQLGTFYPFMRAHGQIGYEHREPFLQSERVQKAIKGAINLRYDLIHYIYTTFYISSSEGQPIVRPTWQEFPQDVNTFEIDEQFMFGDSFLVAPKLKEPSGNVTASKFLKEGEGEAIYPIHIYLSPNATWYNFYTKSIEMQTGQLITRNLTDDQQGVFVRGGSIIPINLHNGSLALLRSKDSPIRLDIYPNASNYAEGLIYLDDGASFKYQTDKERTLIKFTYSNGILKYEVVLPDSLYANAKEMIIKEVNIYGVSKTPLRIDSILQNHLIQYGYHAEEGAVKIIKLHYPIDDGDRQTLVKGILRIEFAETELF